MVVLGDSLFIINKMLKNWARLYARPVRLPDTHLLSPLFSGIITVCPKNVI